tara:strand:- start:207 stop:944 length:738 start_codon:yes stop_codon:yes gene_type:complete
MDLVLKGKIVLIVGGSKGIGLSIVKSFIKEGAITHVISRGDINFSNKNMFHYKADASDHESMKSIKEKISNNTKGKLDIVISNIGKGSGSKNPIDIKDWNSSWSTNFITGLNTASVFENLLRENKGVLIFISSIAGIEEIGAPTVYSSAKAGLIAFSKSLSHKLAPEIRVNVVAPGNIWFEGGTWDIKQKEDPGAITDMLNQKVPLKRFGTTQEVADMVLFLSSSKASFITGGCFVIDGGQTINF